MVTTRPRHPVDYHFYEHDRGAVLADLGKEKCLGILEAMMRIRNFEIRGEAAYQQGKVGGFYHSYMGQEAIQAAVLAALGAENWYVTTYRCHALAILLGEAPDELMAELYGKQTGNAKGRGGSMHFFADRLLGGFGIVGGHVPIATGAAFSLRYQNNKDEVAVCFLGDGAVPQGAVHESLNMASLWSLPCIYVIENNQWGMGTHYQRANAIDKLAEEMAPSYAMESYTLNGMDFFNCYAAFKEIHRKTLETSRPVLVEAVTERFRGHSISDPALYRSKEELANKMTEDPILFFQNALIEQGWITEEAVKEMDKKLRQEMVEAMRFAEESPWPDLTSLEEGVFAP